MNMSLLPVLSTALLLSFASFCSAQAVALYEGETAAVTKSEVKKHTSPPPALSTHVSHKRLPQLYTGLAIEVAVSTYPLDGSNGIFRQFGNVYYEKQKEGGYSYLIKLNFSSKESALQFLENVVKARSGKAKLYQYSEGNREVVRS